MRDNLYFGDILCYQSSADANVILQGYDAIPEFRRNIMLTFSRSNFLFTPTFSTP